MFDEQDGKSMNKNVKNALITVALLTALGGGLFYSTLDRKQETASRTAIADETRRAAQMVELSAALCQHLATAGSVFVDTADALHEAGDLLHAGLDVSRFETLAEVVCQGIEKPAGPVLFKSCGWAGWDLAAARAALLTLR